MAQTGDQGPFTFLSEAYFETVFKVGNVKFVLGETLISVLGWDIFDIYIVCLKVAHEKLGF
jgi:hypothetical protein